MSATIYRALADPHRRLLLDVLRDGGEQSLSQLCHRLPISRQAVSKHLGLLERADLVRSTRRGRERMHTLNAAPMREVLAWAATYSTFWNDRLDALETQLGEPD